MATIKRGDKVILTTGKDKGRTGEVLKIIKEKNKVLVKGCNKVKKHVRANPQAGQPGGIIPQEAAIHISNVAIVNKDGRADRIGIKFLDDGRKVRIFKSNGEMIDE